MPVSQRLQNVAVVLNAKAGALLTGADPDGLIARFAEAGLTARLIGDTGTLPERIEAALATNPDALIVAGGDGTVACAAQIMCGKTDIPLGILPFGTVNLLAKDLDLPIGDMPAAIATLARGRVRAIDAGAVNGHIFLCASMLGLPTRLARHRERMRGRTLRSLISLPFAALRHVLAPNDLRGVLSVGAQTVRIRAAAATVTVNPMAEATGIRFARQSLDGGSLMFYEVRAASIAGWAAFMLRVLTRRWRRDPALREWPGPVMRLDALGTRALHVMVDGEIRLLAPPLDFVCHPGAMRVLVG